jgi:hypothetical protein
MNGLPPGTPALEPGFLLSISGSFGMIRWDQLTDLESANARHTAVLNTYWPKLGKRMISLQEFVSKPVQQEILDEAKAEVDAIPDSEILGLLTERQIEVVTYYRRWRDSLTYP